MAKIIELTEDQIPIWYSFLAEREASLEKQLQSIRDLKEKSTMPLDQTMEKLRTGIKDYEIKVNRAFYSKEMSTAKKITVVLNDTRKEMSSSEIVSFILANYEPERANKRRQLMSGISSVLTLNNGTEKLFYKKSDPVTNENVYGLNEWNKKASIAEPNALELYGQ